MKVYAFDPFIAKEIIEKDKKSGVWIYCKIKDFDIKTWNYSLDKKDLINSMVIKLD